MALDAACPGSASISRAAVRAQATSVVQQRGAQMCGTPGSTALFLCAFRRRSPKCFWIRFPFHWPVCFNQGITAREVWPVS